MLRHCRGQVYLAPSMSLLFERQLVFSMTPLNMNFENSLQFARGLDSEDRLFGFRGRFYMPQMNGKDAIYFCGNSLGLQPKTTQAHLEQELEDWKMMGVKGHFKGKNPWFYYHHFVEESLAKLVGAKVSEVVAMNTLSVNLNLMMVSFYRPTQNRYKIMIETPTFPSDQYLSLIHI